MSKSIRHLTALFFVLMMTIALAGCESAKEQAAPEASTLTATPSAATESVTETALDEASDAAGAKVMPSDKAEMDTSAPEAETDTADTAAGNELADGIYSAEFSTDSSMFHVNEANEGKGVLTVADGKMTIHVSLASKSILNLYSGSAEAALQEGAILLAPTTDSVTYSDGATEEVYGFDIPVPAIDESFAVALIGKKGKWYDHTVTVSNPIPMP
jgi:hypothetical protein